jgi:peroxiredoxin
MGSARRAKQKRRLQPGPGKGGPRPPRGTGSEPAQGSRFSRRTLWLAGGGAIAAIVVVVVVVVLVTGSSGSKGPSDQLAADQHASPGLVAAADAVGFHETTDPGSGVIEGKPASAALPPHSTLLIDTGTKAPDFTLKTPQGEDVSLSELHGKATLLEFFATWCGLCDTEAPHVKALAQSLPAKKYAFLSVNADAEDAGSVFAYHRFYKLPYPSLLDPSLQPGSFNQRGLPGPITQQYGMKALPTFYVIDPKGVITWRSDGEQPDAKLRQELESAGGS